MRITNNKVFVTDPPPVTVDNLRDYLANDKLFMDYFNTFLSLPIFPVVYQFCNNEGLFRVATKLDTDLLKKEKEPQKKRMTSVSARRHSFQPIPLLPMQNTMKIHHKKKSKPYNSNLVLNRRKGLQWLQTERLPSFLQSRLYAEYRLAKILSQSRLIRYDKTNVSDLYLTFVPLKEPDRVECSPDGDDVAGSDSETKVESTVISFGDTSQSEIDLWNCNVETMNQAEYEGDPLDMSNISLSEIMEGSNIPKSSSCVMFANMDALSPQIGPAAYVVPSMKPEDAPSRQSSLTEGVRRKKENKHCLHANNLEELSLMLIAAVVKSAIAEVEEITEDEVENSSSFKQSFPFCEKLKSKLNLDGFKHPVIFDQHEDITEDNFVLRDLSGFNEPLDNDATLFLSLDDPKDQSSFPSMNQQKEKHVTVCGKGTKDSKKQHPEESEDQDDKSNTYFSTNANIREFQTLLKERSCEKNWFLWIDLEKFRQCKIEANKEISILAIKNKYYNTTPHFELPMELKNELNINDWKSSLTDTKVITIQKILLEPFLKYWMPLYLLKKQIQADPSKYRSYFTLKQHQTHFEKFSIPEVDTDVSIFVLKHSKLGEKKMSLELNKDNQLDVLQLPTTYPSVGNRRTYLLSALKQDSVAKGDHWHQTDTKRHSMPVPIEKREEDKKSSHIPCDQEDYIKSFCTSRTSIVSEPQEIWPNSQVTIELIDEKFQVGKKPLPKELSCTQILKPSPIASTSQPSSSKVKQSEEEKLKERKYKLLSSLFKALKCERASGDIFGVYLRDKNLEIPSNCLMLWDAISKFLCLFYNQPVVWPKVIRQVKFIHSEFLSPNAKLMVDCNPDITREIKTNLNNPTGDMFKTVAEHILAILLPSWKEFRNEEKQKAMELLKDVE